MATPLTNDELEFLKNNPDIARNAIQSILNVQEYKNKQYVGTDPVEKASFYMIQSLEKINIGYKRNLARLIDIQLKETRPDYQHNPEIMKSLFEKSKKDREIRIENIKQQISGVAQKIEDIKNKKEHIFLPLGTVVKFKGAEAYLRAFGSVDLPAKGVEGIVIGLNEHGEFPVKIAVFGTYLTENEMSISLRTEDYDEYSVDTSSLEIVELAKIHNFENNEEEEVEFYDFNLTNHCDKYDGSIMLLKSGDRYLQFIKDKDDYGRDKGVALIQAYDAETISDLSIGGFVNDESISPKF